MNARWETALTELWRHSRFTSYFFQSVRFIPDADIPTLALGVAASRLSLYYNETFMEKRSIAELIGLLVHEMLHLVLSHDHRGATGSDALLRNLAQDMVVNTYMDRNEENFFSRKGQYAWDVPPLTLPPGLPRVPRRFYRDTGIKDPSWEDVYRWLFDSRRGAARAEGEPGAGLENDSMPMESDQSDEWRGGFAEGRLDRRKEADRDMEGVILLDGDGEPAVTGAHLFQKSFERADADAAVRRFLSMAARDGSCRDERACQDITAIMGGASEVDTRSWRRLVRSIVDYTSSSNEWTYTYGRFNRRYFAGGIYAPGRLFKQRESITVAVDVSASMVMTPGEIEAAFGVIEDLCGEYRINLVCIDDELFVPRREGLLFRRSGDLDKPYLYRRGDWERIKSGSSGTTFFAPLFNEYMMHHREMLIVITDGHIYDLDVLRRYTPTLWLVSEHRDEPFEPHFGRVVVIRQDAVHEG